MNQKETLLQQLSDIRVPEPVGLWPPALGWWILAVLILSLTGVAIFLTWRHRQKTRYRKQALRILHTLEEQKDTYPKERVVTELVALLKRSALTAYKHSRSSVAHLYGHEFFVFLEAMLDHPSEPIDKRWHAAIYQKSLLAHEDFPLEAYFKFARQWIRKHPELNAESLKLRLQTSDNAKVNGALHHG